MPGRDDEWKRQTVSNTSELQFDQEFGNNFHGTGNTLIAGNKLLEMKAKAPIYTQDQTLSVYERPDKSKNYMMFVDVAKGRGQDYSTFNLIDISAKPFKQVAVYRDNTISPLLFPDIIYKYAKTYNYAYVVIESNDQGSVVCNGLYYELEYENVFVESMVKKNAVGVEMTRKVKRIGCSNIKDLVERDQIEIVDAETIIEFSTFCARGSSYEASDGNHDDLVMNFVLFGWFVSTNMFNDMTDISIKQMMYNEQMRHIEDELVPFGIVDNGVQEKTEVIDGDRWEVGEPTELF